ncbi:hypothetical protein M0R89_12455 [Halorussus limi]|uniref:Uncharacterized protein n=1 Tax=Halorussus limi TaxID=2938695 RepID=A0A8U0HQP3_9EURY|nr:hypothetical protein [Halorussus limi]UPV73355.1 hypothetical protein M0R89_12455 [Halorussus limi]
MELTWLIPASVLLVGVGYVTVRRAPRPRFVNWTLLGASLFALATRDLFRSRERGQSAPAARESATETANRQSATRQPANRRPANRRPDRDDDPQRTPLFVRLRRRVAGWLN